MIFINFEKDFFREHVIKIKKRVKHYCLTLKPLKTCVL